MNISLSSVSIIVWIGVPNTATLYFLNIPALYNWTPQLSAVWPPNWSKIASGFSLIIIFSTDSLIIGKKYVLFAKPIDVW